MNGVLTGYKISYYVKGNQVMKHQLFEPSDTQGTIYNLVPGKTYVFQIQAHTKVGPGHKALWEETMPIWSAPPPADNVFPTEVGHTSTTIRVRFRKNYFSNMYGSVNLFAVIVAEDDSISTNLLDMPSWHDVQEFSVWPPYQASEPFYPFNQSNVEDFTVGTDDCSSRRNFKYCNGPLKPGSTFKIKIRAFTTNEKFTDTVYSYSISTDPDNTAIYLGVFLPLLFLLLMAGIVLYLKQRRLGPFSLTKKTSNTHHSAKRTVCRLLRANSSQPVPSN